MQFTVGLALGVVLGALAGVGIYYLIARPSLNNQKLRQTKAELHSVRQQLRQGASQREQLARKLETAEDEITALVAKTMNLAEQLSKQQAELTETKSQKEGLAHQLSESQNQREVVQSRLRELELHEEALHKRIVELTMQNDRLNNRLEMAFRHNDSMMVKLTEVAGHADQLQDDLFVAHNNNDELTVQVKATQGLLDDLATLQAENEVLQTRLAEADNLDLPERFGEVVAALSHTRQVLEAAMVEFGGLQARAITIETLADGLVIGSSAVEVSEIMQQRHELETKLAKTSRLLADVWSRYRLALNRLQRSSNLVTENKDLYMRLRVAETKVSILQDKLVDIARLRKVDDLQRINGITADFEARLRRAGVDTFDHLSQLSAEQLRRIVKAAENEVDYANWVQAAKRLAHQSVYVPHWLASRPTNSKRPAQIMSTPPFGSLLDKRLTEALRDDNKH